VRRSKARDLSEVSIPIDPLHLPEYPLNLSVEPRNGRDRRRMTFDFTYLQALGEFGRQLIAAFVAACREMESKGWRNTAWYIHPFLRQIARQAAELPQTWSGERWKIFADGLVSDMINSPKWAQSSKNTARSSFAIVLTAAFNSKIIPRFKLRGGIKNAVRRGKMPIAQAPAMGGYETTDDEEATAVAQRLEKLTAIHDPGVHKERHEILSKRLLILCQKQLREGWDHFRRAQRIIRSPIGLDAQEFVRQCVSIDDAVSISDEGYHLLKTRSDYLRILAHPVLYEAFIRGKLPSRLRKRLTRNGHLTWYHSALHLTPAVAVACEGLLLLDLNHEVSSALRMKRKDITLTHNRKMARLAWYKGRSHEYQHEFRERGSVTSLNIGSELQISSFMVAKALNVMRRRLRAFAPEGERDSLFLVSYIDAKPQNVANVLSMKQANVEVTRLREMDSILSNHHFTFDRLRVSILFDGHLRSENILKTSRQARHRNIGTTQIYTDHLAADMRSVEYVREVQDLLALCATAGELHERLGERLGISDEKAKKIHEKAHATGFGQWKTCGDSTRQEANFRSSFQHFLANGEIDFIEDAGIASEIFAYRRHILAEAPAIRGTPDWYEFWAPLLLMLNVAWNAFRADIKLEAIRLANELHIEYLDAV
jgi:hypothetical protein